MRKSNPTVDLPLSEAVESLTGWEVTAIQKQFNSQIDNMGGVELMMGATWAYRNRDGAKASWSDVKDMSIRQLRDFFADESREPDDEVGKE